MQAKDLFVDLRLDRKLLCQLAAKRGFQFFALFNLTSRKLPLHSVRVGMMALADQHPAALYYDAGGDKDGFLLLHEAGVF